MKIGRGCCRKERLGRAGAVLLCRGKTLDPRSKTPERPARSRHLAGPLTNPDLYFTEALRPSESDLLMSELGFCSFRDLPRRAAGGNREGAGGARVAPFLARLRVQSKW